MEEREKRGKEKYWSKRVGGGRERERIIRRGIHILYYSMNRVGIVCHTRVTMFLRLPSVYISEVYISHVGYTYSVSLLDLLPMYMYMCTIACTCTLNVLTHLSLSTTLVGSLISLLHPLWSTTCSSMPLG